MLARRTTPSVLADATCLVVLQRGVGGNRLADPVVAASPPVAGSVHKSNVTKRPGPVRTACAESSSSQLDAGSTVATLSEPLTGDEIRQPAFALGAVVLRRTEAAQVPPSRTPRPPCRQYRERQMSFSQSLPSYIESGQRHSGWPYCRWHVLLCWQGKPSQVRCSTQAGLETPGGQIHLGCLVAGSSAQWPGPHCNPGQASHLGPMNGGEH